MVDLSTDDEFEAWLKNEHEDVSVAIAARAAWRVLPLLVRSKGRGSSEKKVLSRLLRRSAFSLVAVSNLEIRVLGGAIVIVNEADVSASFDYYPIAARSASSTARAINCAARSAAIVERAAAARFTKYATADAADAAANAGHATGTRFAAVDSAATARLATAEALRLDIKYIADHRNSLREVINKSLWLEGVPYFASQWAVQFANALTELGDDFSIWADWYDAVLKGGPRYHDAAFARAVNDLELWERKPAEINAQIKKWLEEERDSFDQRFNPQVSIDVELDELPAPPRQIGNTHVGIGPDGRLGYVVADGQGNNRQLLDQVLDDARALARDASQAIPENAYKGLSLRAHDYALEINRSVEDIRWARVVFLGIRLEQARDAAVRDISREGTPPLDDDAQEKVSSLLEAHHILVGATKDGVEIRQIQFEQAASVAEQREFQKAAASVAQGLAAEPDAITPELRDDLLAEAEAAPTSEKAAAANRALVQNTVTGLSVAGTLGVISYASASYFGAGGFVAATGINFFLLEGLKRGKRFQELCQTIGDASNRAIDKSRDAFERRILLRDKIVELEAPLRQLARAAKWPWLERYVDFANSLKDTDKS